MGTAISWHRSIILQTLIYVSKYSVTVSKLLWFLVWPAWLAGPVSIFFLDPNKVSEQVEIHITWKNQYMNTCRRCSRSRCILRGLCVRRRFLIPCLITVAIYRHGGQFLFGLLGLDLGLYISSCHRKGLANSLPSLLVKRSVELFVEETEA
jgi:hypothetical protein